MKTSARYRLVLALLKARRKRFQKLDAFSALSQAEATKSFTPSLHARLKTRVTPIHRPAYQAWSMAPRGKSPTAAPHVLYLHGGAFVFGPTWAHWRFLARTVDATACTVQAPVYPRAPEHSYAQTQEALLDAYTQAVEMAKGRPFVLAGDSAGACLALWLAQQARRLKLRLPQELILIAPCPDLTLESPGIAEIEARDPWLTVDGLRRAFRSWLRDLSPASPVVNPMGGAMFGLPSTHVFAGDLDLLLPDCVRLVEQMRLEGVNGSLHFGKGMCHVWPLLPIPEARDAERVIQQVIRRACFSSEQSARCD